MTNDEAAAVLLERLGLTAAALGEARFAEHRRALAAALATGDGPPTSWYDVYDRITALERLPRGGAEAPCYDFGLIYGPLNLAVNTDRVTWPREVELP
jgi:hypothetical protein